MTLRERFRPLTGIMFRNQHSHVVGIYQRHGMSFRPLTGIMFRNKRRPGKGINEFLPQFPSPYGDNV